MVYNSFTDAITTEAGYDYFRNRIEHFNRIYFRYQLNGKHQMLKKNNWNSYYEELDSLNDEQIQDIEDRMNQEDIKVYM